MLKTRKTDAGWDLIADHDAIVSNKTVTPIHTGDFGDIPVGHVGLVCPRSGLAMKHGVTVVNAPGLVDAGYDGELIVLLSKFGDEPFPVKKGDRIAQLCVVPLSAWEPELSSDRAGKGFGSSGVAA